MEKAIFAGGCFWSLQKFFDSLDGVVKTTCGYTGGKLKNPTYKQVLNLNTGHYEAVEVVFDQKIIPYKELVIEFLSFIDPTDNKGQGCDVGDQYKTAIFYLNNKQKKTAEELIEKIKTLNIFEKPIAVKILKAKEFYKAEDYHQKYYKNFPNNYAQYEKYCFRKVNKKLKELLK